LSEVAEEEDYDDEDDDEVSENSDDLNENEDGKRIFQIDVV
jgi:hypothetical protein